MFRLAHFSDPHLGPLPNPSTLQLLSKRIFGYLNWTRNRAKTFSDVYLNALLADLASEAPDHIALTGDLVNIALPAEIESAGIWLRGLALPENMSVVPGNHDAYVPGALNQAKQVWGPYMLGDGASDQPQFPFLRRRGPVALICCSSSNATLPFMATGTFSEKQMEETAKLLQATKDCCRVVLIHHPPFPKATPHYKRLIGADRFRKMIADNGAELILHGHTHIHSDERIDGPDRPVPVIGVPSASNGPGHKKPAGCYNLFSISEDSKKWSINWSQRGVLNAAGKIGPVGKDKQL
ncbi:MAG: metallophosphoesterase [Hyphomicrobiales bacterium]